MNENRNDDCSICLNELNDEQVRLDCYHIFHLNCLLQWFTRNNTCPMCRKLANNKLIEENIINVLLCTTSHSRRTDILNMLKGLKTHINIFLIHEVYNNFRKSEFTEESLRKKSRLELISICKEIYVKGYSKCKKQEIIRLILAKI